MKVKRCLRGLQILTISTLIFTLALVSLPQTFVEAQANKNITFQPNQIPFIDVYYDDYTFVFNHTSNGRFIRVAPFVISNGLYYSLKQIVTYLKNKYPQVNYAKLVKKAVNAIHYGFNLTSLPQAEARKLDYLGFKLVDLNFPLSWFKLENNMIGDYEITYITIPKANLWFSFEDLYSYGYSVQHVNSTYVLIGNVKGKTNLYLDPITFSGGVITVNDEDVSTEDIDDADDANGWGVVNQTATCEENQYDFGASVVLTNTSTWTDTNVQLTFNSSVVSPLIKVETGCTLTFGTLVDATDKTTSDGVSIYSKATDRAIFSIQLGGVGNFYSCQFGGYYYSYHRCQILNYGTVTIYNSLLNAVFISSQSGSAITVYRITLSKAYNAFDIRGISPIVDDMLITDSNKAVIFTYGGTATLRNVKVRNAGTSVYVSGIATSQKYLINSDFEAWTFLYAGNNVGGKIYRQYELELTLFFQNGSYAEGANVTISNAYLGTSDSWISYANGSIPQQTYSMGHYNQTGVSTIYDYNPYNLTVTLDGYDTYTDQINITKKEDLRITLTPTSQDGEVAATNTTRYILLGGLLFSPIMLAIALSRRRIKTLNNIARSN